MWISVDFQVNRQVHRFQDFIEKVQGGFWALESVGKKKDLVKMSDDMLRVGCWGMGCVSKVRTVFRS